MEIKWAVDGADPEYHRRSYTIFTLTIDDKDFENMDEEHKKEHIDEEIQRAFEQQVFPYREED